MHAYQCVRCITLSAKARKRCMRGSGKPGAPSASAGQLRIADDGAVRVCPGQGASDTCTNGNAGANRNTCTDRNTGQG